MALRTARSTVSQRAALIQLEKDLREAFAVLPARFWASHDEVESYKKILNHIERWIAWEERDD